MTTAVAVAPNTKANTAAPAAAQPQPALVVLGRDENGKPHASWFDASEAKLASKAAALMSMVALSVGTDEIRALAAGLPHGRIFASGKAFVPFVRGATFDRLVAHLPKGVEVPTPRPAAAAADGAGEGAGGGAPAASVEAHTLPTDWPQITKGCLVLASEGGDDGWYESVVLEDRGEDVFVLQWRDWPDLPTFARRRADLALLHPSYTAS